MSEIENEPSLEEQIAAMQIAQSDRLRMLKDAELSLLAAKMGVHTGHGLAGKMFGDDFEITQDGKLQPKGAEGVSCETHLQNVIAKNSLHCLYDSERHGAWKKKLEQEAARERAIKETATSAESISDLAGIDPEIAHEAVLRMTPEQRAQIANPTRDDL